MEAAPAALHHRGHQLTGEALEIVDLENGNQNLSNISNQNPLVSNERDDGEPGRCQDNHCQGGHRQYEHRQDEHRQDERCQDEPCQDEHRASCVLH